MRNLELAATEGPLSSRLPLEAIRVGVTAGDWRAAVRAVGEALVASGATTAAYTDEMIATVDALGPYIVIAPGIALAHARPSAAVHQTGFAIVTLAEPVAFGHTENDPVRIVVGLAAPDEIGHVDALATLADFLADPDRQRALLEARDPAAIHALVLAYERGRDDGAAPAPARAVEGGGGTDTDAADTEAERSGGIA
ncbi:MAG TPA: PTS sugar transporter subunit IIA [Candidatus Binatia bacterium]|nr:PTS sugar transporter subunit IIA [Candidatus Binatia bacterium]